jgi:IgGFc binding protein
VSDASSGGGDSGGLISVGGSLDAGGPGIVGDLTCADVAKSPGNAGCTFYPVQVPEEDTDVANCFAMTVVNPGDQPAKLSLEKKGVPIALAKVARLPRGTGNSVQYAPFDESVGLAGGDVALIFLAGGYTPPGSDHVNCPAGVEVPAQDPFFSGTYSNAAIDYASKRGAAFRLSSDRPVIAYQTYPYGGGTSKVASATLLLPVEAWGTNYFAALPFDDTLMMTRFTTITAASDQTEIAFRVTDAIKPTTGPKGTPWVADSPSAAKGSIYRTTLNAGEFVELETRGPIDPVSGNGFFTVAAHPIANALTSTKPVSVVGGSPCQNKVRGPCDSTHQQIPPLNAMGHRYAAVGYRNRCPELVETIPWQIMGLVDGTKLTFTPHPTVVKPKPDQYGDPSVNPGAPAAAPTTVNAGQVVEFYTADPFVVESQDQQHPFYLAGYMTGSRVVAPTCKAFLGDPEFVNVVPVEQFMNAYIFFTDPSYPTTNLVVVRAKDESGKFADVKLACAQDPLSGWQPLGDLEYTRVDLTSGAFKPQIPGCDNGRNRIESTGPFSITVWGWGSDDVMLHGENTRAVSYAYPGGSAVRKVNDVSIPTIN